MGSKIGTAEPAAILRPTLHRREGKLGGGGGNKTQHKNPKHNTKLQTTILRGSVQINTQISGK